MTTLAVATEDTIESVELNRILDNEWTLDAHPLTDAATHTPCPIASLIILLVKHRNQFHHNIMRSVHSGHWSLVCRTQISQWSIRTWVATRVPSTLLLWFPNESKSQFHLSEIANRKTDFSLLRSSMEAYTMRTSTRFNLERVNGADMEHGRFVDYIRQFLCGYACDKLQIAVEQDCYRFLILKIVFSFYCWVCPFLYYCVLCDSLPPIHSIRIDWGCVCRVSTACVCST